jgi:hypothetical protein
MRSYSWIPVLAFVLLAIEGCSRPAEITAPTPPNTAQRTEFVADTSKHGPGTLGGGN